MKKFKLVMLLLAFFALALLTGCGASVKSFIDFKEDGSGRREIVCTIKNEDIKRLRGGEKELDEVLKNSKPEVLSMRKAIAGDAVQYTFAYEFKNFNEYIEKTEKIINRKPDSKFTVSGGMFNKTYTFNESDITGELIKWAADSTAKYYIEIISPEDIYEVEGGEISFINKKLSTKGNINISTNKVYDIEKIEIITYIDKLMGYNREILYTFSKTTNDSLNSRGNGISNFMLKLIPKGGKLKIIDENSLVTYKISFSSNDIRGLNEKTRTAVLDQRASMSLNRMSGNTITERREEYIDSIDFSKLLEGSNIKEGITYILSIPSKYKYNKIGDLNVKNSSDEPIKTQGDVKLVNNKNSSLASQNYKSDEINFNAEFTSPGQLMYVVIGILIIIIFVTTGVIITRIIISRQEKRRFKDKASKDSIEKTWTFETDWTAHIGKNDNTDDIK